MLVNSFDKLKSPSSSEESKALKPEEGGGRSLRSPPTRPAQVHTVHLPTALTALLRELWLQNDSFH